MKTSKVMKKVRSAPKRIAAKILASIPQEKLDKTCERMLLESRIIDYLTENGTTERNRLRIEVDISGLSILDYHETLIWLEKNELIKVIPNGFYYNVKLTNHDSRKTQSNSKTRER